MLLIFHQSIVDTRGNHGHLRLSIGPGSKLRAGRFIWMTAPTPHKIICQEEGGDHQFFMVIHSTVSHWYVQHSTPNPNVTLPSDVIVVEENKFL